MLPAEIKVGHHTRITLRMRYQQHRPHKCISSTQGLSTDPHQLILLSAEEMSCSIYIARESKGNANVALDMENVKNPWFNTLLTRRQWMGVRDQLLVTVNKSKFNQN
jgi:hypothetical protein